MYKYRMATIPNVTSAVTQSIRNITTTHRTVPIKATKGW